MPQVRNQAGPVTIRVLIGGERFGVIRDAFRALGHDAWSCDTAPTEAPGPHIEADWRTVLNDGWDLGIFHPTCTNMSNSGALRLYSGGKKRNGPDLQRIAAAASNAWDFWDLLNHCPIPHRCLENPVMHGIAKTIVGRKQDQSIQPNEFGDDASKETCLWLQELPKLIATTRYPGRLVEWNGKIVERWSNQTDSGQNVEAPTKDPNERRMKRAKTYPGIAAAMADQWGRYVKEQKAAKAA